MDILMAILLNVLGQIHRRSSAFKIGQSKNCNSSNFTKNNITYSFLKFESIIIELKE